MASLEVWANGLSAAMRSVLTRQQVRIGNPVRLVPTFKPPVQARTWEALRKRGMVVYSPYGWALTDHGCRVREYLNGERQS